MSVDEALRLRKSIRAFRPDPIPHAVLHELLELASRAPSGTNIQPWEVHVVTGDTRRRLAHEVLSHRLVSPTDSGAEFIQRAHRKEPYLERMRTLGKEMYRLLNIPKGDQAAVWEQWGRNYKFFDAPVGLIITIDKDLDRMSYVDLGAFIQSFLLAATTRGLGTCVQGAWNSYWSVTRRVLDIADDRFIVCGVAVGYADEDAAVNLLVSTREPVTRFAFFD
jgi:nitroreductase